MRVPVALALLTLLLGCSTSPYRQGMRLSERGQHDEAAAIFRAEIARDAQNHAAWRELGVAYYKSGDLAKAEEALGQAERILPDARTSLYLGLVHEAREEYDDALAAYRRAIGLDPGGKTGRMIRGHLDHLIQIKVQKEVRRAIAQEDSLKATDLPEHTVAVAEFDRSDLPPELAPLSTGFVEFTAIDLAKVNSLRVVERAKIQELLQELQLSSGNLIDPATRLRVGLLVGSRNVISGSLQSLREDEIEVHGAIGNTVAGTTDFVEPAAGALEKFFTIQKQFVFAVIDRLGITLTPEERDAIQQIPTESFLALMAYCQGLEHRDRGDYTRAAAEFRKASAEDGSFSEARVQAETAADVISAGGEAGGSSRQSFESAVVAISEGSLAAGAQEEVLANLIDSAAFVPVTDPTGQGETLPDDPATLPDTGTVGAVNVIVRGDLHGSR
jgi:tetratricopeptide (TPR) repeat protein